METATSYDRSVLTGLSDNSLLCWQQTGSRTIIRGRSGIPHERDDRPASPLGDSENQPADQEDQPRPRARMRSEVRGNPRFVRVCFYP